MKKERTEERQAKIWRVLKHRQSSLTVVLENVDDPHNVMAACRSCESVGIAKIHAVNNDFDTWTKKVGKRSSAGTRKWLPIQKHFSIEECYEQLRKEGKKILTTNLSDEAISIYETDMCQPIALVFGNEQKGVSEQAAELADGNIIIPQVGMIESLNVSVACALSVYEAYRQRTAKGMYNSAEMSQAEMQSIYDVWIDK